jgi:hypothetical protein
MRDMLRQCRRVSVEGVGEGLLEVRVISFLLDVRQVPVERLAIVD